LIGQAFLEAHKVFKDSKCLEVAASICDWVAELPREKTDRGACLSYVMFKQSSIHNSNMLGAALLGQVGRLTNSSRFLEIARDAMLYSVARIRPDGSWWYGEEPMYHWIDNFHTGYNLDSLKRYIEGTGDRLFEAQMKQGFEYFERTFFETDGCPRYYDKKKHPIDIQCAAQAIDTLALFSDLFPVALDLSRKVASWTIRHMQDADGHFYYRDVGWTVNRTAMFHWGQGTTAKALAHLLGRLRARETGATARQPVAVLNEAGRC
jgi:hypothetical protein